MKKIAISVLVPSLNRAKYIEKCLKSIHNQTLNNIEVICIDAGSTDGTIDVIDEYVKKDSRFIRVDSPRKSYGFQLNTAIDIAQGEYVTIVESDDYILPDACEFLYKNASENKLDFFRSGVNQFLIINNQEIVYKQIFFLPSKDINKVYSGQISLENRLKAVVSILGTAYRKEFLKGKDIRANESSGASFQDVGFCIQVNSMANRFMYSNKPVYNKKMDNEDSSIYAVKNNNVLISEYEFLDTKVDAGKANREIVYHQQIMDYYWRLQVSEKQVRQQFLSEIHDRIIAISCYEYKVPLTEVERFQIEILLGNLKKFEDCEKGTENNALYYNKLFYGKEPIVVVSMGKLGKKLIALQKYYGRRSICAVCDNDKNLQGDIIDDYVVLSVEKAVNEHKDAVFIVANKLYSNEIQSQLISLGIEISRILLVTSLPAIGDIVKNMKTITNGLQGK